jgi:hypothetical protein
MASINEVYGQNFQQVAKQGKADYAVNLYAVNLSHREFNFRNDSQDMWQTKPQDPNNMLPSSIQLLIRTVSLQNKHLTVLHIPKTSPEMNMFPYLINGPVEYFVMIDTEPVANNAQPANVYLFYITPYKMAAY